MTEKELEDMGEEYWYRVGDILNMTQPGDTSQYVLDHIAFAGTYTKEQTMHANNTLQKLYNVVHTDKTLSYYKEKAVKLDKVLNIFIRVNSGGTVLTYSDLLLSIASAQWENHDAREEITDFVDEVNSIGGGFRINKDFVLKTALVLTDFSNIAFKVDNFNKPNMMKIEANWENIKKAIKQAVYLECVLMGTIILSTKAAKRIPAFDKDYILILGCQIKKDGTLTNLLKGRADRAIEFAKMQEEASGKDIVFIPSGGKGDDEIISEAEAIRNYLVETGIDESCILVENKSANTFENLRNSMELIRKDGKADDPKIAFSTTNYHVFRSGVFASQQGIRADGIGAKTKRYFWINAFIREFIAALVSEWKIHFAIIFSWIVLITMMIGIVYFSNNL